MDDFHFGLEESGQQSYEVNFRENIVRKFITFLVQWYLYLEY